MRIIDKSEPPTNTGYFIGTHPGDSLRLITEGGGCAGGSLKPDVWVQVTTTIDAEGGMAVTVGRVRACPLQDLRMVSVSHNTLRGAASGAVLNAELLVAEGYVSQEA